MSQGATPQPARYLLDSNTLLRISDPTSATHQAALDAVAQLTTTGAVLCITAQNLVEFWNVATRPKDKNGLGFSVANVQNEVAKHQAAFTFLPDAPAVFGQWERLVSAYEVKGVQVHDTRLCAVALTYKVGNVLTFNGKDFRRFAPEGITAVDPASITKSTP